LAQNPRRLCRLKLVESPFFYLVGSAGFETQPRGAGADVLTLDDSLSRLHMIFLAARESRPLTLDAPPGFEPVDLYLGSGATPRSPTRAKHEGLGLAKLEELIQRAEVLVAQQRGGVVVTRAATRQREKLRRALQSKLLLYLRAVGAVADGGVGQRPECAGAVQAQGW